MRVSTLPRLLTMDREEILGRARQELLKRCDTARSALGYRAEIDEDIAPDRTGRFFFDSADPALRLMRKHFSHEVQNVIERADRCCKHLFDLLGYEQLDYGREIDWHFDAVHNKRAPRAPFYKIRFLDFKEVGDAKVTWELNRHQHFVTLALAYRLTGDERFAREIRDQWHSWHTSNPYPFGINWSSSLEVAFRSLSWLWMMFLLDDSSAMQKSFRLDILRALSVNGRHIARYLSTYFSPNTHLLGEGVALFFIGTLCPQLRSSGQWRELGWSIVLEAAQRQVRDDGVHFEQSTYYHVYALDFFLHAIVLASRNPAAVSLSPEMLRRIESMLDALSLLARCGVPPKLGDDDGGRLFHARRNRPEHMADPLAVGAVLFNRPDLKYTAREPTLELLWLLGEAGLAAWNELPSCIPDDASSALPEAGLYCLSNRTLSQQLIVDAGAQGGLHAGHGHADALSVCLYGGERELLIDSGTGSYVDAEGYRTYFRGTRAHNTLQVDGLDQAETRGPFGWMSLPDARTERWVRGNSFDLFAGSHNGYLRLQNPVLHRRWVVSIRGNFWLVRDVAEGIGKHRLTLRWHLGPQLQRQSTGGFTFLGTDGMGIAIVTPQGHGWKEEVSSGCWSPVYGATEEISTVQVACDQIMPAEFVTLLQPIARSNETPGALTTVLHERDNAVSAYRYQTDAETYFIVFSDGDTWRAGPCASDAEFLCLRTGRGEGSTLMFCYGSWAEVDRRRVAGLSEVVPHCELALEV